MATLGLHHLGLTVPNASDAAAFFESVFAFKKVGEKPDYPAIFVSDGTIMLTLWQVENPDAALPCDRKSMLGLHHFALKVSAARLDDLHAALQKREDIAIEFAPESLGESGMRHMMFTMPGNIRVELLALS